MVRWKTFFLFLFRSSSRLYIQVCQYMQEETAKCYFRLIPKRVDNKCFCLLLHHFTKTPPRFIKSHTCNIENNDKNTRKKQWKKKHTTWFRTPFSDGTNFWTKNKPERMATESCGPGRLLSPAGWITLRQKNDREIQWADLWASRWDLALFFGQTWAFWKSSFQNSIKNN